MYKLSSSRIKPFLRNEKQPRVRGNAFHPCYRNKVSLIHPLILGIKRDSREECNVQGRGIIKAYATCIRCAGYAALV